MDKEKLARELKRKNAIVRCAREFSMVGDPTRMKICWLLCKHPELSVGEIADILAVSLSVVSHSLKKLRENDLVNSRREHKTIFYRLSNNPFNKVLRKSLSA